MSLDYSLRCHGCGELLFDINITHNLIDMAKQVLIGEETDLYKLLWSPPEINNNKYRQQITEGYTTVLTEKETLMKYESENGWGTYEGFEKFVHDVATALFKYPLATIEVSK